MFGFAMNRNQQRRSDPAVEQFQLLGAWMARGVNGQMRRFRGDDVDATRRQSFHQALDITLVSGNGASTENYGVSLVQRQVSEAVMTESVESRPRFSLTACSY